MQLVAFLFFKYQIGKIRNVSWLRNQAGTMRLNSDRNLSDRYRSYICKLTKKYSLMQNRNGGKMNRPSKNQGIYNQANEKFDHTLKNNTTDLPFRQNSDPNNSPQLQSPPEHQLLVQQQLQLPLNSNQLQRQQTQHPIDQDNPHAGIRISAQQNADLEDQLPPSLPLGKTKPILSTAPPESEHNRVSSLAAIDDPIDSMFIKVSRRHRMDPLSHKIYRVNPRVDVAQPLSLQPMRPVFLNQQIRRYNHRRQLYCRKLKIIGYSVFLFPLLHYFLFVLLLGLLKGVFCRTILQVIDKVSHSHQYRSPCNMIALILLLPLWLLPWMMYCCILEMKEKVLPILRQKLEETECLPIYISLVSEHS